jgi:hypothetical protein
MSEAFRVNVNEQGESWVERIAWGDKSGLSEHYAAIGCELVQVAGSGAFGGVPVIVFVDEEGLYREPVLFNRVVCDFVAEATDSAPAYMMGGGLVGRALVLFDSGSDSRGFTKEEADRISAQLEHGGYPTLSMFREDEPLA